MQWESLGFKENPFSTDPITLDTLELYTGRDHDIAACRDILSQKDVLLIIEGERGVGTTSFGNCLRFHAQNKKDYLTPHNEIRVEPNWNLETLLAAIIANIIREIEFFHAGKITKEPAFKEAKALSNRIAETYRSFGIAAFGAGFNYGKSAGPSSQPNIVPSSVLGHHLEDLAGLVKKQGYQNGVLVQLNNLDLGTVHDEKHLCYLFNALRDYIQTKGMSWLLIGDIGLRSFIAQEVDRLDDIVTFETDISPLTIDEFKVLINRRIEHYRSNKHVYTPIDADVFDYLYDVAQGRLRYIFGLLQRLISHLHVGALTDRLTLEIVKPMVKRLAKNRVSKKSITSVDEEILKVIVNEGKVSVSSIAKISGKSINQTSNILAKLNKLKLVSAHKEGKYKYYFAELDSIIAYTED